MHGRKCWSFMLGWGGRDEAVSLQRPRHCRREGGCMACAHMTRHANFSLAPCRMQERESAAIKSRQKAKLGQEAAATNGAKSGGMRPRFPGGSPV